LMMPVIYLVVGFGVAIFLLVAVMPQFASMFESMDSVEMPAITALFINVGDFVIGNAVFLVLGVVLYVILLVYSYRKSRRFRRFISYMAIRMPILGQVVILNNLSRIAATLSQMLNNHIPLQECLATTYDTLGNRIYQELIVQAQKNVNAGDYMSAAFEQHYAVEVVFVRMISVGERTGDLGQMLTNLSEFYNEDSDIKIERLKKALEPILLIFIFSLIVVMLMAVMLPSLSFASQI